MMKKIFCIFFLLFLLFLMGCSTSRSRWDQYQYIPFSFYHQCGEKLSDLSKFIINLEVFNIKNSLLFSPDKKRKDFYLLTPRGIYQFSRDSIKRGDEGVVTIEIKDSLRKTITIITRYSDKNGIDAKYLRRERSGKRKPYHFFSLKGKYLKTVKVLDLIIEEFKTSIVLINENYRRKMIENINELEVLSSKILDRRPASFYSMREKGEKYIQQKESWDRSIEKTFNTCEWPQNEFFREVIARERKKFNEQSKEIEAEIFKVMYNLDS